MIPQCKIPLLLQKKREFKFKFNFNKRHLPFFFKCISTGIPIITNYHSGNYVSSLADHVVDTAKFDVLEHKYKYGAGPYYHADWGDSKAFTLKETGVFDLNVSHYTLAGDRMNFHLSFYDANDNYLGQLEYHKDSYTWSRGNYTTIKFWDNSNHNIDLNAGDFAGTSYGNGYFHQTIDFRDPNYIKTYPETYLSNTHQTNVEHSYNFVHSLQNTKKVLIAIDYSKATYFSSTNGSVIELYLSSGFDYFGQLVDRPGYPA